MTGCTDYVVDIPAPTNNYAPSSRDSDTTLSLGPKSRAKLLESVMMKKSEKYASNYRKTKNRGDQERAMLLIAEARPDIEGREIMKEERTKHKLRQLKAGNSTPYTRNFRN